MSARGQLKHRKSAPCGTVGHGHREGLWRFSKGAYRPPKPETRLQTIERLTMPADSKENDLSWLSNVALDHLLSIKANINLLNHMVFQYKLLFSRQ
jgi:hypothetical protein